MAKKVEKVEKAKAEMKVDAEVKEAVKPKKAIPPRPPKLTPIPTSDEDIVTPALEYGVKYLFEGKSGSSFMASLNAPAYDDKFPRLTIYEVKNNCTTEKVIDVPDISVYKTTKLTAEEIADRMI